MPARINLKTFNNFLKALVNECTELLLSALPGVVFFAVAAIIFPTYIISAAGAYMGGLQDAVSLAVIIPLSIGVLIICLAMRSSKIIALYPLTIFYMGAVISDYQLRFVSSVMGVVGLNTEAASLSSTLSNKPIITAIMAFWGLHLVVYCVSKLMGWGTFRQYQAYTPYRKAALLCILIVFITAMIAAHIQRVWHDYDRTPQPLYIKTIEQNDMRSYLINSSLQGGGIGIVYTEKTVQSNGTYAMVDVVDVRKISADDKRGMPQLCDNSIPQGKKVKTSYITDSYKKHATKKGHEYWSKTSTETYYNNGDKYEFPREDGCAKIDQYIYSFGRRTSLGDVYIKKYPTSQVIDALFAAKTIKVCPEGVSIGCSDKEFDDTRNLIAANQGKMVSPYDALKSMYNNRFEKIVKYLEVPEWGVKFPLQADIADMYYVRNKFFDRIGIGLHSLNTKPCAPTNVKSEVLTIARATPPSNLTFKFSEPLNGYVYGFSYYTGNSSGDDHCQISNRALLNEQFEYMREHVEPL